MRSKRNAEKYPRLVDGCLEESAKLAVRVGAKLGGLCYGE